MDKLNKRIEVITDLVTVKIIDAKEKWMLDILFNHNIDWINLVRFKFDWSKFFVESPKQEALEKYLAKKQKEEEKLNRRKTEAEQMQDAREMRDLPTELEEIKVLYRKTPSDKIIDMVSYINELINA